MRYVVIGDLHLGGGLFGPEQVISKLRTELEKINPDRVIFLGDIFDSSLPDPRWVYLFNNALKDFEWYYIPGNHDMHIRLNRLSTMVFGDKGEEVHTVGPFLLIPWSYAVYHKMTPDDFVSLVRSYDKPVVVHHFAIEDYPKAHLLKDRELVVPLIPGYYQVAGHIHEGMKFENGEHPGSFVPVKVNELFYNRWLVIFEESKRIQEVPLSWPYVHIKGDANEVISQFESIKNSVSSEFGVIYIETSDRMVLSYDLKAPDGWILRLKLHTTQENVLVERNDVSPVKVSVSLGSVVEKLIDQDEINYKEEVRTLWREIYEG